MARPLSLTIRLFANMYAGEKVTAGFLESDLFGGAGVFMGLHVFVSFLQAYIFVLLTMMYCRRTRLRTSNINPALCRFQCEPGCTRMTGTTSWRRILNKE